MKRESERGPSDWALTTVRAVASISTGARDTQDRTADGRYPFFVRSQTVERIDTWAYEGEAVLTAGDGVGTGKVFHYIDGRFDYHQRVYKMSDFSPACSGLFFFYYFRQYFLARVEAMTAKSSVDSVRMEIIAGMPIPLPSLSEQGRIVEVLSDLDDLLATLDRVLAKKRDIKRGAMQRLLTGMTRLPGFSGEWHSCALKNVLSVRHGKSQKGVEALGGRYPILATGGEIGRTNTPLYSKPSVLIGRKGTIDKPQYRDQPFWTVDTLFYTEIFDAEPKYLFYLFLTIDWLSLNEASGVPSLGAGRIENLAVTLPGRDEQRAIARALSDLDAEINGLEEQLEKLEDIKRGVTQELLTGRSRLRHRERGEIAA